MLTLDDPVSLIILMTLLVIVGKRPGALSVLPISLDSLHLQSFLELGLIDDHPFMAGGPNLIDPVSGINTKLDPSSVNFGHYSGPRFQDSGLSCPLS